MAAKISPQQHRVLTEMIRIFDQAVEKERSRWGEESAKGLALKGLPLETYRYHIYEATQVKADPRTFRALKDAGYIKMTDLTHHTQNVLTHAPKSFGRWDGGSKTLHSYEPMYTVTPQGRAYGKIGLGWGLPSVYPGVCASPSTRRPWPTTGWIILKSR